MKKTSYVSTILIVMSMIILAGCAQTGMRDIWPLGEEEKPVIAESMETMPGDAAQVVTATAAVMLGLTPPSGVTFSDRAAARISGESDVGEEFRVSAARLFTYETSPD